MGVPVATTPMANCANISGVRPLSGSILHFLGGDGLADGGVFGVEQGRVGRHLHGSGGVSDRQPEIDDGVVTRANLNAPPDKLLEPVDGGDKVVLPRRQERQGVLAGGFGDRLDFGSGANLGGHDFGAGHGGSSRVRDGSADGAAKFLAESGQGQQGAEGGQ